MVLTHCLNRDIVILVFPFEQQSVVSSLTIDEVIDVCVAGGGEEPLSLIR